MSQLIAVSWRTYGRRLVLVAQMFCLAAAVQTRAQVVGGTILGMIADQSGGVVPRAQILIKNLKNGFTRTVTTDAAGFYAAPNLLPGTYEVTASAAGFAATVRDGVSAGSGARSGLMFR